MARGGPDAGADRDRHLIPVEEPGQPPDPGAGPELEVGLGSEVSDLRADLVGAFAPGVVPAVPVGQRVLAARLVVPPAVHHQAGIYTRAPLRRTAAGAHA